MFRNLWQRGLKDWWSVGRGWFVRALGMAAIGAAIGYLVVRLMHLQGWIVGAVAGSGAAVIWGFLTLAWTVLVGTPKKIIEEKDEALADSASPALHPPSGAARRGEKGGAAGRATGHPAFGGQT